MLAGANQRHTWLSGATLAGLRSKGTRQVATSFLHPQDGVDRALCSSEEASAQLLRFDTSTTVEGLSSLSSPVSRPRFPTPHRLVGLHDTMPSVSLQVFCIILFHRICTGMVEKPIWRHKRSL